MLTKIDFGNGLKTFFNSTPHAVNVIADAEYKNVIRKWVGGREIAAIPPSGVMLSATLKTTPVTDLGSGVEICKQVATACDPLPDEARQVDYVIVSAMYGLAYRQIHGDDGVNLVTIRDLVVASEDNPKPVGCRGFAVI